MDPRPRVNECNGCYDNYWISIGQANVIWTPRSVPSSLYPENMLLVLSVLVEIAILVGMAFIVGKTMPSMPNKVCRFVFIFVLCLLVNFGVNYFNVRLAGYHKMGWTGASIIALLLAIWGTFRYSPQPHNSNTP